MLDVTDSDRLDIKQNITCCMVSCSDSSKIGIWIREQKTQPLAKLEVISKWLTSVVSSDTLQNCCFHNKHYIGCGKVMEQTWFLATSLSPRPGASCINLGAIYTANFKPKTGNFLCVLSVYLHDNSVLGTENAFFRKRVSKCTFLKVAPLSFPC